MTLAMRVSPRPSLVAALLLLGCPPTAPEPPAPTPVLGLDPGVRAQPGEARAGVIRSGEAGQAALFGGIGAEAEAGDVKLYNDRVQFIIGAPGRRHGWVDVGGTIVDADLVRPPGEHGQDALDDLFLGFGVSRVFEADSVQILADGSDGPARVRTVGRDVPFDLFVRGLESPELFQGDLGLSIVRDYELAPDSDSVRITTTLTNAGAQAVSALAAEVFMYGQEDFGPWFADRGLRDSASGEVAAAGYAGRRGEHVLSVFSEAGTLRVSAATAVLAIASLSLFNHERIELEPGDSTERVARVALAPDIASAEAHRLALQGVELAPVAGVVTDGEGPVAGARVHFVSGESVYGYALTDAAGRYQAELPAGDWELYPVARHATERLWPVPGAARYGALAASSVRADALESVDAPPVPFAGGRWTPDPSPLGAATNLDLSLPSAGTLVLDAVAADSAGAIFDVFALDELPPALPEELAEAFDLPGRSSHLARVWSADGHAELSVPPGRYRVVAGHGWRHDRAEAEVDVPAGGQGSATLALPQAVPRDGWVSVDTHLHGAPSMDGEVSMEGRLIACASAGLDVPINTDHDRFADYRPLAEALGLADLAIIPGSEVTTVVRGHFNVYPVEVDPSARNGGALVWWDREPTTTQDLADRIAANSPDAVVQANHGRMSLGMTAGAGWQLPEPTKPDYWTWDFDVHEVVTAGDVGAWRQNRDDWFDFINLGALKAVVGSSDTHDLGRTCGFGHTDVFTDGDTGADAVVAAIRAGRTVAASGVTLRATLRAENTGGPGQTVIGGQGSLEITVRGPAWVRPGVLRVYRDGELWHEEALAEGVDGLIASRSFPVDEAEDRWFAVEVDEGQAQGQAWGGHPPYALTNALFLDVEGDGWIAPMEPR